MKAQVFRLPLGVRCSSNNGKVCVSGNKGKVFFYSVSNLHRKGDVIIFLPYLNPYQSSIFMQAVQGVVLGYTIELNLKGIGYKVSTKERNLILSLGYSKPVILNIPEEVSVKLSKKSFSLISPNMGVLQNFATIVRSQRFPDSYKGAGILYGGEIILCKEGKKT